MTDITVNAAGLSAAYRVAEGGTTLRLPPGDYSKIRFKERPAASGQISVVPADPASPPRFIDGLTLDKPSNLRFAGVDFDISSATAAAAAAVRVYGGQDLAFIGGRYRGREVDPARRWGQAINATGVIGLTIERPDIEMVHRGIVLGGCEDVTIIEPDLFRLGSDGINFGQCKRVKLLRPQLGDFAPYGADHPDGIQFMTGIDGAACEDVLIEDPLIVAGLGPRPQGIFARTENVKVRHKRITILRPVIVNAGNHAITLGGTDDFLIEEAVCLFQLIPPEFQPATGFANKSWIKTDTSNGVVRNNRAMTFIPNKASVNESNVEIPAATQAETDAAVAAWRAKFRAPAKPGEPKIEPPARDVIGDLIRQSTVVKQEALKTKGRVSFDWKTPAEAAAFLAAVLAIRPA